MHEIPGKSKLNPVTELPPIGTVINGTKHAKSDGPSISDANEIWAEVLKTHGLEPFEQRFHWEMRDRESIEQAAIDFVAQSGDAYKIWTDLLKDRNLSPRAMPRNFERMDSEEQAALADVEFNVSQKRQQLLESDELSALYKEEILRLTEHLVRAEGRPGSTIPARRSNSQVQLNRLLEANAARCEWEKSDQLAPPPELAAIEEILGLAGPDVGSERMEDFPVYIEETETGYDGTVDGLADVIRSLATTVAALAEWSELQAEHMRKANKELRELIEQRTLTSLLSARNAWLYEQAANSNESYEQIRRSLNLRCDDRNWKPIGTAEGVRQAVHKFCDDAGIARPQRKSSKQSN